MSVVARGITVTIDGTDNEHTDAIQQMSSIARTGWMDGWENRQKETALRAMLMQNQPSKDLSDTCKLAYTVHLYKYPGCQGGGVGVKATQKRLRSNQILKWKPFPPEPFEAYMLALEAMPELLEEYRATIVANDALKPGVDE